MNKFLQRQLRWIHWIYECNWMIIQKLKKTFWINYLFKLKYKIYCTSWKLQEDLKDVKNFEKGKYTSRKLDSELYLWD